MKRRLFSLIFLGLAALPVVAQEPAAPVAVGAAQGDSVPFVSASLMVAEPGRLHPQSAFGHAFLRMQCPSAALDYCFSMESGDYEGFLDICLGRYPNRLVCVPTAEYVDTNFHREGRAVTECPLSLTTAEGKRLWQLLDETCARGLSPHHDYFHHGCSQEIVRLVMQSLDGSVVFGDSARQFDGTLFTLGNRLLPADSWLHLPPSMLSTTDGTDRPLTDLEKTAFPLILPSLLADAAVVGSDGGTRPLFVPGARQEHLPAQAAAVRAAWPVRTWFLLLLAASLACVACIHGLRAPRARAVAHTSYGVVFAAYNLVVGTLWGIGALSTLPTISGWNWNFLIYNPLPLVLWLASRRRPFGALCWSRILLGYALWLGIFAAAMALVGNHQLAEQHLLTATWAVWCLSASLTCRKQNPNNH